MASDGKVVFQIEGDARGVKNTIKDVTADIEKESKKWDNAVKESSDDMTKSFAKAFDIERLKNWGIQAAKAIGKFIGESISAASDLAEVQNVVDVTFGESAKKIDSWAQSAGNNFGLTETQAKRYASTIGSMLKSQGVAQNEVLDMSESLAGLAADMASFYNLDFDTAFEKIRSGISGETMPLKQLGINMSVANLEAFALSQGIEKSYSAMSQGEQTLIRYQYLMKATADAQGDFVRTSDGFANSTRRISSSIESLKAKVGTVLLQVVEPITDEIADMLEMLTEPPKRTVLDDFADIADETAQKAAKLQETADLTQDIISMMRDLEAQTVSLGNGQFKGLASIFEEIANVERSGGNGRDYIKSLGLDVENTYRQYQIWNESIKQLTGIIPNLTSVINEETGAIDGGTAAIQKNRDEFIAAEEKKLAWTAYYAKARALEEAKGNMYMYKFEAGAAQEAAKRQMSELASAYGTQFNADGSISNLNVLAEKYGYTINELTGQLAAKTFGGGDKAFAKAVSDYYNTLSKSATATAEYKRQTDALTEAEQELADGKQYLIDLYDEETAAALGMGDAVEDVSDEVKQAQQDVKTYMQTVRDATAQMVDNIVKGFTVLERPTTDMFLKRSKLIEQQNELNRSTKDGEKRYQELQVQIDELNKSMDQYSTKGMQEGLESQLAFMDEYIKNLERAQEMGLSGDLLASLSDGSVQSAEYLAGLVANPEQAQQVDALFQQVQEKKKGFVDALSEQKLAADDTFNAIVEKAKSSVSDLAMGDEAAASMSETISGIAQGIMDKVPDVRDAVDAVLEQLNRLSGYGVNMSFSAGNFGYLLDGSHETGLDYVPFDGYLASLHEGESILTAEENRIWQRFKNGAQPQTMDYDALGATMRENVQAGGNVYLDGKTVGRVISDQQGNAYRQLQRSGWQQ